MLRSTCANIWGTKRSHLSKKIDLLYFPFIFKLKDGWDVQSAAKEAYDNGKMNQPGVLMIGQKFFVKIDKKAIHFPADVASLEEAVGLSLAYSYILDTKYPEALKFVYLFFEHLFRFENFWKQDKFILEL